MKLGILFSMLTAVLFVTLEPVSKLIANDVTPYAITLWRFIIGALMLMPLAIMTIKKKNLKITLKDMGMMTVFGIFFICFSMIALQIGVKKADSPSLIAIIFSSNSIFTILFAMMILKEKLNKYKVIALILGALGVIVCADFSSGTNLESVLYALFAAISFSLYTILSQKYVKKFGSIVQLCLVFTMGSLVLLIALLALGSNIIPVLSAKSVGVLVYLGIFVTGLGYICYIKAIEKGGTLMASLTFFAKPILTPFATLFVNGIAPDAKIFISVVLVVLASYFATCKKKA